MPHDIFLSLTVTMLWDEWGLKRDKEGRLLRGEGGGGERDMGANTRIGTMVFIRYC